MKIEWQIPETFCIDKEFLENLVIKRHLESLDFLSKEMRLGKVADSVRRILFAAEKSSAYYRAGELYGIGEDTIKLGLIGQSSEDSEIIDKIKWDSVHETMHHLHYKKNPAIIKNKVWGRTGLITYPLDNWYSREIVGEYGTLLFYKHKQEKLPFEFLRYFWERVEPVIDLYRSNKTLLKELVECDELNIPEKFIEAIRRMDDFERKKAGL